MPETALSRSEICKLKIRQVFGYLKALNDHRNPAVRQVGDHTWHFWLDRLPDHPTIELLGARPLNAEGAEATGVQARSGILLRVRRPALHPPPSPPETIRSWLHAGWDDPDNDADTHSSRNEKGDRGETVTIRFEDDPVRRKAFDDWRKKRENWRKAEKPAREAMAVFEKIYALHGKLERESELFDLVLGDGLLSWNRPEDSIYHPLLIQRVQLEFDATVPEFKVVDSDAACELHKGLFHTIPEVDPAILAANQGRLEASDFNPSSPEASAFLREFINQIAARGEFLDSGRPPTDCEQPTVGRGPVLFLRSRTKGFGTAIEQVLDSVASREDFCEALEKIVGCSRPHDGDRSDHRSAIRDRDVLLAKEANAEQFRIAAQLDRHGCVLVQGPPGTGKSHTIANLIGHLLAQGQSVLVTSHTTKALRVLRGHVIEQLRPLCVSVLESDAVSRDQLAQSVRHIAGRLAQSNAEDLEIEASRLQKRRGELTDAHEKYTHEMLNARTDEYRQVVFGGCGYAPADAARKVAAGRERHDWIPGPVALGEPMPLSTQELEELYATNATTLPDDDRQVGAALPNESILVLPEEFGLALEARNARIDPQLWENAQALIGKKEEILKLSKEFRHAIHQFKQFSEEWQRAAIGVGARSELRPVWDELLEKIDRANALFAEAYADIVKHQPEIASHPPFRDQFKVAEEICKHLLTGGELRERRLFGGRAIRQPWRNAYDAWQVSSRPPECAEEFSAIHKVLGAKVMREDLGILWDGLLAAVQAPRFADLSDEPERTAAQYAPAIRQCLGWWNRCWSPLIDRLGRLGFRWNHFMSLQQPNAAQNGDTIRCVNAVESSLIGLLEHTATQVELLAAARKLQHLSRDLQHFERPEVVELRLAIESRDSTAYCRVRGKVLDAEKRQTTARRRAELLSRLNRNDRKGASIATGWAAAIRNRDGVHGESRLPGDPSMAWEWRQLNDELERRLQVDLDELGNRISDTHDELRRTTGELIDRLAWAGQVRRTTPKLRQALTGWLDTIERIGRGTGRRTPALRREAQKLMDECRPAVPVWIMPLARLVESFDFGKRCFDVVIIDEASQCDAMALLAVALAKKIVIVGDDQQVSPLAVGQRQDIVDHLIHIHLQGIPNSHLYDGQLSIYDLAQQTFEGVVLLLEHFRCVPDIIQFSNHLCYQGDIKPLREKGDSRLHPNVVPYRVQGKREGDVNREEALTIASLIVAAIEHPEYRDLTFGVISLLGSDQAAEIERILLRRLPADEYQRRQIVCGNSAQFQGDERDVMFLSMVWSSAEGPLPCITAQLFRQRFNVAASRAKNQMWLVHSLDAAVHLQPGDLRRRLIEHVQDPGALTRELDHALARTQSPFEKEVLGCLMREGYRVTAQWPVGAYRIDFVIEGGGKRLALECDGDRYHPPEQIPKDMERQAILERLGWRFMRIRGSQFYRDRDATMRLVFERLQKEGIPQEGAAALSPIDDEGALVAAIKRRAAEIRAAWQEPSETEVRKPKKRIAATSSPGPTSTENDAWKTVASINETSTEASSTVEVRSFTKGPLPPVSVNQSPATVTAIVHPEVTKSHRPSAADKTNVESQSIDCLMTKLDRLVFPAVADTEPRGSRRGRMNCWREVLNSADGSPEEVFDALVSADPRMQSYRRWAIDAIRNCRRNTRPDS